MNKKILIVDSLPYIYKLYYGLMKNDYFTFDSAINFIIKKLLNIVKLDYVVFIFDHFTISYKKILYKKYKINRKKNNYKFIYTVNLFKKKISLLGIKFISIPNIEADDIIGTLSLQCERNFLDVFISSFDKDLYQLVSDKIKILDIFNKVIIDKEFIYNKYNITSDLIIDYISLMGDSSDNIKGVIGIGPKTSSILINKLGSINLIYKNINKISNINEIINKKKVIENLIKYKNNVMNAYSLIKINRNIFTGYNISDFKYIK